MTEYPETIKKLRELQKMTEMCSDQANCSKCEWKEMCDSFPNDEIAEVYQHAADAIEALQKELRLCRNELCQHCGEYIREYAGACDDCRWYAFEREEN